MVFARLMSYAQVDSLGRDSLIFIPEKSIEKNKIKNHLFDTHQKRL